MSASAAHDQQAILRYLYQRVVDGNERFCTLRTIKLGADLSVPNQYFRTIADDLEILGFINTRQVYKMSGGRLFQISARGIDLVKNGHGREVFDSSKWTGIYDVSETKKREIQTTLAQIRRIVEDSELANAKKSNALALIQSAEALTEAPDPLWPIIVRILGTAELGNIVGIAGLLLAVFTLIRG